MTGRWMPLAAAVVVATLVWMGGSPAAGQAPAAATAAGRFTDVTSQCGAWDIMAEHYRRDPKWWLSGFTLIDLDGDGDLDLHLAGHGMGGAAGWNDGKGRFTAVDPKSEIPRGKNKTQEIPFPGGEIRLAYDLDEDGQLDILASYGDGQGVVYRNLSKAGDPPAWNFKPVSVGLDAFSRAAAFVDLNRDGLVDYLLSGDGPRNAPTHKLHVALGKGGGTWEDGPAIDVLREAGAMPVDVNGDGFVDLLVSQRGYNPSTRYILLNDGKGNFAKADASGLPEEGSIMGPADVDQDGDNDLVCIDGSRVVVYLNDGKGRFTPGEPIARLEKARGKPKGGNWGGAVATDFDNDGLADVAVNSKGMLYFLRGTGGGKLEYANDLWGLPDTINPAVDEGLCFGDIDGDGDLDVVTAGRGPGERGTAVFRNDLPARNYLRVRPIGRKGNTAAAGSIVRLLEPGTGKLLWWHQVILNGKQSFHSYYFTTATERHFGLGDRAAVDVVVEFYPSGKQVRKEVVKANTTVEVREE